LNPSPSRGEGLIPRRDAFSRPESRVRVLIQLVSADVESNDTLSAFP
jgi:hypothetical protein